MNKIEFSDWLEINIPKFTALSVVLISLIENILRREKLEFLSITGRPNNKLSVLSKLDRKKYINAPEEMTDLCGIRVITFLDTQVRQIENTLRSSFDVDNANSSDRSKILREDKVGYRSIHVVATLGDSRSALPEYTDLQGFKFEIQIRTVLQHAWAELAHDRSFKFGITLPTSIQRKLNLHAGLLEVVDTAFIEIAREIDDYKIFVEAQPLNRLLLEQIDEISLSQYVKFVNGGHDLKIRGKEIGVNVINELRDFGLVTIKDINVLLSESFISAQKTYISPHNADTPRGFIRDLMMYTDIEKYFLSSWKENWKILDDHTKRFLLSKYDQNLVETIIKVNSLSVMSEDEAKTLNSTLQ